jgi:hypothetical protein
MEQDQTRDRNCLTGQDRVSVVELVRESAMRDLRRLEWREKSSLLCRAVLVAGTESLLMPTPYWNLRTRADVPGGPCPSPAQENMSHGNFSPSQTNADHVECSPLLQTVIAFDNGK